MRKTVAAIADIIEEGISASDVEEVCRGAVVDEIEERARLIVDDEIERLIEPIVGEEVVADPEERIDGGEVELTDIEFENLPEESRAVDREGNRLVIVSGRAYRARIFPDSTARTIAAKLSNEIRHALAMLKASGEALDGETVESLSEDADGRVECPDCGSEMVTMVWVGDGDETYLCSECGEEFSVPVGEGAGDPAIEDLTSETVDIVPGEMFGTVCFDGESWPYEVWVDGECVQSGSADEPDEAYALFEEIGEVYASIGAGTEVRCSGSSMTVRSVSGGVIDFGGPTASRAKMSCLVVSGRAVASNPEEFVDEVREGDEWVNESGSSMTVERVDGDTVEFEDVDAGERGASYLASLVSMSRQEFMSRAVEGGYRLVQA